MSRCSSCHGDDCEKLLENDDIREVICKSAKYCGVCKHLKKFLPEKYQHPQKGKKRVTIYESDYYLPGFEWSVKKQKFVKTVKK